MFKWFWTIFSLGTPAKRSLVLIRQRTIFFKATDMFCFFSFSLPGFISHPRFLWIPCKQQYLSGTLSVILEFRGKTILQWNLVNAVINGPKQLGRFNGVAVLPGQGQISWLRTVLTLIHHTSHSYFLYNCVLFNKLQECRYRVPWNFPLA